MTCNKHGTTLIEVMVALIVFSVAISITSQFVKKGIDYPFISHSVEKWIMFVEKASSFTQELPSGADLGTLNPDTHPFNTLVLPADAETWAIEVQDTNLESLSAITFSVKTSYENRSYQWRIYRTTTK